MTKLDWRWKQFEELSVFELHELLQLRQNVFVIEQNCVYADIDDADKSAWHLLGFKDRTLCAYARVIPPKEIQHVSIGRVISSLNFRGQGIGKQVMRQSLGFIQKTHPELPVKISAQQHLEKFYAEFGFVKTSEPYDEDGIMHIDMIKR